MVRIAKTVPFTGKYPHREHRSGKGSTQTYFRDRSKRIIQREIEDSRTNQIKRLIKHQLHS